MYRLGSEIWQETMERGLAQHEYGATDITSAGSRETGHGMKPQTPDACVRLLSRNCHRHDRPSDSQDQRIHQHWIIIASRSTSTVNVSTQPDFMNDSHHDCHHDCHHDTDHYLHHDHDKWSRWWWSSSSSSIIINIIVIIDITSNDYHDGAHGNHPWTSW